MNVHCPEDLVIESYPGAVSQILTNFITNTLTYALERTRPARSPSRPSERDTLDLTYSDDGCGISPDVQDKIFEPFYTTARAKGSTGLGLHIVFNIVTNTLGGTITCCSAPGHGTTFQVCMPV